MNIRAEPLINSCTGILAMLQISLGRGRGGHRRAGSVQSPSCTSLAGLYSVSNLCVDLVAAITKLIQHLF